MVTHEHFPKLAALAARAPSASLVLGHAGLPLERTTEYRTAWQRALRALAAAPNVVCKISALASGSDPQWTVDVAAALGPRLRRGVRSRPDACWRRNWPIDRLHGTYGRLVDAYREILAELSQDERAAVLHGTAERIYRLAPISQ